MLFGKHKCMNISIDGSIFIVEGRYKLGWFFRYGDYIFWKNSTITLKIDRIFYFFHNPTENTSAKDDYL